MSDDNLIDRRRMLAMGSAVGAGLTVDASAPLPVDHLYGDAIRLSEEGATRRTFGDETAIVQRAIDTAVRTRRPLFLDRAVRVSRLRIEDANGLFVFQTAPIVGMANGSFGPLLTVANSTDITWAGRLWLSCQWNPEYETALAFVAREGQVACNIAIQDWAISGARTAFLLGEQGTANGLISEITIQNGTSYGCPMVVDANGHNTLATFNGGSLIANHLAVAIFGTDCAPIQCASRERTSRFLDVRSSTMRARMAQRSGLTVKEQPRRKTRVLVQSPPSVAQSKRRAR